MSDSDHDDRLNNTLPPGSGTQTLPPNDDGSAAPVAVATVGSHHRLLMQLLHEFEDAVVPALPQLGRADADPSELQSRLLTILGSWAAAKAAAQVGAVGVREQPLALPAGAREPRTHIQLGSPPQSTAALDGPTNFSLLGGVQSNSINGVQLPHHQRHNDPAAGSFGLSGHMAERSMNSRRSSGSDLPMDSLAASPLPDVGSPYATSRATPVLSGSASRRQSTFFENMDQRAARSPSRRLRLVRRHLAGAGPPAHAVVGSRERAAAVAAVRHAAGRRAVRRDTGPQGVGRLLDPPRRPGY
jgi:hypothetical protein